MIFFLNDYYKEMYVSKLYSENNNYPENSSVLIIICEVTTFFF